MTNTQALQAFSAYLRNLPSFHGDIRTDLTHRILYSTDASIYQIEPLGVVFPSSQDDLFLVAEAAVRFGVPLLPRGSGSSLAGQAIGAAMVVDLSRHLDRILEIDPEKRTARVEPGVILAALNRAAARYGLQFGPDPASADRATLGGVIGNNGTGAHSIAYGMAADHILSAEVIFGDGGAARLRSLPLEALPASDGSAYANFVYAALEIRQRYADEIRARWPRTWRNSAGYRLNYLLPWSATRPVHWPDGLPYPPAPADSLNLPALLAGSEGTLAIFRTLTVNLVPRPQNKILVALPYDDLAAACDDVPRLLAAHPSAVELIPRRLLNLARGVPAYARRLHFVEGDPAALLVVEFSGAARDELLARGRNLGGVLLESAQAQADLWAVRKAGLGILMSQYTARRPVAFIEDTAVPVEKLGGYVRAMQKILRAHHTEAAFYAHASAGCLHIRPALDLKNGRDVAALREIARATFELASSLGGAMASEHGDGLARAEWLEQTYGPGLSQAMRALKRAADPQHLLNPGKLLDAPPLDTHLRYGADYRAQPWQPILDFSGQGGLDGAIEHCNGAGVCRKTDGLMCPSFQATRDEGLSTRGRANLLRALISGGQKLRIANKDDSARQNLAPALERAVAASLDLCLACKGCKAECPSGVDMAKLKTDFFAQYYRHHPRKLRDYIFSRSQYSTYIPKPLLPIVNWITRHPLATRAAAQLGIAPQRALPALHQPASEWAQASHPVESVLLLPDAFTHLFEPDIETAAYRLLAACGVRVLRLPVYGAGRPLLSKSFLRAAQKHAARVLEAIHRADPSGALPLIGLEPSEVYAIHDEFPDLLPARRGEIEALSARTWMIDEYLIRPDAHGRPRIERADFHPADGLASIHLHGHCHQKARPPAADGWPVGQEASAELLRAAGYQVEIIPSGCCGMAGAFGYEREHYELSMKIGEQVLFPYLREHPHGQVAAPGASCRAQIADGVARAAEHPVVLAARCLTI